MAVFSSHVLDPTCLKTGTWRPQNLNKIICLFWQTNIPLSGSHLDEAVSSACQFQLLVNRLQLEAEESKLISSLTLDVVPPLGPHDLHRPCVILYLVHGRLPIHFFL